MSHPREHRNPVLEHLGYDSRARVAIIHADDVGMCDATLAAFAEIAAGGFISSGSLMAPAPYFSEAAAWAVENPAADVGLHLTLTSEWENWRWHPLSPANAKDGLISEDGFMHRTRQALVRHARADAVRREMEAQLAAAEALGVFCNHLDTHMHAATEPQFLGDYLRLGLRRRVPVLVTSNLKNRDEASRRLLDAAAAEGMPLFDYLRTLRIRGSRSTWTDLAKRTLDSIPPGLNCLLTHPARETDKLKAIVPNWVERLADYEVLMDPNLFRHAADTGLRLIRFEDLREVMCSNWDSELASFSAPAAG